MTLSWQLYPEGELAAPPPVQPLHKPTPITQADFRAHDNDDEIYAHCAPNKCSLSDASPSRKRESYNMSGSTYLVTSSGVTLSLPIPSDSQSDPLNWGCWKTAGAIAAIAWYSVMASTAVQAASQILPEMAREFGDEVGACMNDCTVGNRADFFVGSQAMDNGIHRYCSHIVHGCWCAPLVTTISGTGQAPGLLNRSIDDATGNSRSWSREKFPRVTGLRLHHWLRRRFLAHFCKLSRRSIISLLILEGFFDGDRHDFYTSAT